MVNIFATINQVIEIYFDNLDSYDSQFGVRKVQTRFYDKDAKLINHNPPSAIANSI